MFNNSSDLKQNTANETPIVPEIQTSTLFFGQYAFEATPYWPWITIVQDSNGLYVDDIKVKLTVSGLTVFGQTDSGEEFKLTYEPDSNLYILSAHQLTSTRTGLVRKSIKRILVKVKPNPNEHLEKEYGVRASDLVKAVRESEDWIQQVTSFQVKAKDKWIRTPEGIEFQRKELQERFPDAMINSEKFSDLMPTVEGKLKIVFNDTKYRTFHQNEDSLFEEIWNGHEFIAHNQYFTPPHESYSFRKELPEIARNMIDFIWPRSKEYHFWWKKQGMNNWEDHYGRAEDFILTGKQNYLGTECYIVECYPGDYRQVRRWFIGVKDHLKYGDLTYHMGRLCWDYWTGDYKEVRSGWWFPMTQGYHGFDRDENENSFVASRREITIEEVQIDQVLPDELFEMEFKEGVKVTDDRFGGWITYPYKKDRTKEEWEQIHQKAQKRIEEDNARKNALDERIGQVAMEFPSECKWINTEPLTMEKLRGKAVILQFWSIQCGPCHNYMGMLRAKPSSENIVVIGIHTAESDLSNIKADMDKYKSDGPTCVDVGGGWGKILGWYRVNAIPYWIAIGPDSKILGHSHNPSEVFQLAQKASD